MVRFARVVIVVAAYNVHVFVAGVPVQSIGRLVGCPHPDQVVQPLLVHEGVEHELVQRHAGFGTVRAPPEPCPARFVQRAPDEGDSLFLQGKERIGDNFHVADNRLVFVAFGLPFLGFGIVGLGDAEFGVGRVSARLRVERLDLLHRVFPVPVECGDSAGLPDGLRHLERGVRVALVPLFFGALAGGVQEVESHEGHVLAACLVDVAEFCLGREILRGVFTVVFEGAFRHDSADGALAEVLEEESVELLCAFGRFGCDGRGADIPGGRLEFGNLDVVDLDPSPGLLDADGVLALGKFDFSGTLDDREFVGEAEADLACGIAVQGQVLYLVGTVGGELVVDEQRVVAVFRHVDIEQEVSRAHVDVLAARCLRVGERLDFVVVGGDGVFRLVAEGLGHRIACECNCGCGQQLEYIHRESPVPKII